MTIPTTEHEAPNRAMYRRAIELPKLRKSKTDTALRKRTTFRTDREVPIREKLRTDNELPKHAKSNIDWKEPQHTSPVTDIAAPLQQNVRNERELPKSTISLRETLCKAVVTFNSPKRENPEPRRPKLRNAKVLPTLTKSNIETTEPQRVHPKTDRLDPTGEKLRRARELATFAMLRTEIEHPSRATLACASPELSRK